jgi:hypothetical protein
MYQELPILVGKRHLPVCRTIEEVNLLEGGGDLSHDEAADGATGPFVKCSGRPGGDGEKVASHQTDHRPQLDFVLWRGRPMVDLCDEARRVGHIEDTPLPALAKLLTKCQRTPRIVE